MRKTLPYLLLKVFCVKIHNVGDVFASRFFSLEYYHKVNYIDRMAIFLAFPNFKFNFTSCHPSIFSRNFAAHPLGARRLPLAGSKEFGFATSCEGRTL